MGQGCSLSCRKKKPPPPPEQTHSAVPDEFTHSITGVEHKRWAFRMVRHVVSSLKQELRYKDEFNVELAREKFDILLGTIQTQWEQDLAQVQRDRKNRLTLGWNDDVVKFKTAVLDNVLKRRRTLSQVCPKVALDANGDGAVSSEKFAAASTGAVRDRDQIGIIEPELLPSRLEPSVQELEGDSMLIEFNGWLAGSPEPASSWPYAEHDGQTPPTVRAPHPRILITLTQFEVFMCKTY